jgi:hypothetical protein
VDSIGELLGREANTRRPTLPPSALPFDGKTAAALATSGTPLWTGRVPMTETIHRFTNRLNFKTRHDF